MVDTPFNTSLFVEGVRAWHGALGANLAVVGEASDRLVDQINCIFIADMGNVSTRDGAVSLYVELELKLM